MKNIRSLVIEASLERVWEVAANQFGDIGQWSASVRASRSVADGRICSTSFGETLEALTSQDAEHHRFTYVIEGAGMPGFIERATNTWSLEPLSSTTTRLTMTAETTMPWWATLLFGLPMSLFGARLLGANLEELKHYIETGQPHPRKLRAMGKSTPQARSRLDNAR